MPKLKILGLVVVWLIWREMSLVRKMKEKKL